MHKKHLASTSTLVLLASSVLVACGGGGGSSPDASTASINNTEGTPIAATVPNNSEATHFATKYFAIPNAPTQFRMTANDHGVLSFAWNDTSSNETSFMVQWRKLDATRWEESPSLAPDTTAYTTPKIGTGTYIFRVWSHNGYGTQVSNLLQINVIAEGAGQPASAPSPAAAPTPAAAPAPASADASATKPAVESAKAPLPAAVSDLKAKAKSGTTAELTWKASTENVQGHRVQWRLDDAGQWNESALLDASANTYTTEGMKGGSHAVRVQSFNSDGAQVTSSAKVWVTVSGDTEQSSVDSGSSSASASSSSNTGSSNTGSSSASAQSGNQSGSQSSNSQSSNSQQQSSQASSASSGGGNSIDTIIGDMRNGPDVLPFNAPAGAGWATGNAFNIMGNSPRADTAPWWWNNTGEYPGTWNHAIPWMLLVEGQGNAAYNTRIQMKNLRMYIKSKSSGAWNMIQAHDGDIEGTNCGQNSNYLSCTGGVDKRAEPSGGVSILPASNMNFHGYGHLSDINGGDVAAVLVNMQGRLVTNGGSDDRDAAKYMLQVGGDYYPVGHTINFTVPAIGISRSKLLNNGWQFFNMATLTDAGIQEMGGGISSGELRSNPPPLN